MTFPGMKEDRSDGNGYATVLAMVFRIPTVCRVLCCNILCMYHIMNTPTPLRFTISYLNFMDEACGQRGCVTSFYVIFAQGHITQT